MSRELKQLEEHIDELMRRIGELEQEQDIQCRDADAQSRSWVVILVCLLFIDVALFSLAMVLS